jgi:hypothetical protein
MSQPDKVNPVAMVCIKERKSGLKRLVVIADHANDAISIGSTMVDGVALYQYAAAVKAGIL